jgi:GT2 family glycosyltransferase
MLIPIIEDYYQEGRIPPQKHRVLLPFFPNCNLSLRREVCSRIKGYDESLVAAEDSDLCRRAALAGYALFYEPDALVHHACRPDLRALIQQWFSYGYWSASVYRRYMEKQVEIYGSIAPVPRVNQFTRLISLKKFPFRFLLFLSYFAWLLLLSMSTLLFFHFELTTVAISMIAILFLYLCYLYFSHPALRRIRLKDQIAFVSVSIVINLSCVAGSFLCGLRRRFIYLFSGI